MAKLLTGTRIYGTANIDSQLIVGNITPINSTSNTTGSLVVTGGAGISGNLYATAVYSNGSLVLTSEPIGSSAASNAASAGVTANNALGLAQFAAGLANGTAGVANTDYTTISIPAITTSSNGLYVPVITVAANGRVTSITNTAIIGGGSSSGFSANSIIVANSTGYLSTNNNLQYNAANNAILANASITIANTQTSNSATMIYNATLNSIDFYFN